MKISILTYGSRGDVQPYMALAVGLKAVGHIVRLPAPARFSDFVGQYGIDFTTLDGDPLDLIKRINDIGHNPLRRSTFLGKCVSSIGAVPEPILIR
jgi:UDP:flavonoid glycosyltransferase YjiC (YdhE family)